MILNIDPKVDCVFKALLGSEENKDLLIHFLNAMMTLPPGEEILDAVLLNTHLEREHLEDKLSIVDVLATDNRGHIFQVELQVYISAYIEERIGYNWSSIVVRQMKKGRRYQEIRPVVSIWLLGGCLFPKSPHHIHRLQLSDKETGAIIMAESMVCIVELPKLNLERPVLSEGERWQRFFLEGERLDPDNLPEYMKTPEMEKAMATLKSFYEKGGERELMYMLEEFAMLEANSKAEEERLRKERMAKYDEFEATVGELVETKGELDETKGELVETKGELVEAKGELVETKGELVEAKGRLNKTVGELVQTKEHLEAAEAEVRAVRAKALLLKQRLLELGIDPGDL